MYLTIFCCFVYAGVLSAQGKFICRSALHTESHDLRIITHLITNRSRKKELINYNKRY